MKLNEPTVFCFFLGLPTTATKEEVEKLFSQFGIIKDTRLVTFRNGMNKGEYRLTNYY